MYAAVSRALLSGETYIVFMLFFSFSIFSRVANAWACALPFSVSSASEIPQASIFTFQLVSPWRVTKSFMKALYPFDVYRAIGNVEVCALSFS